MRSRNEFCQALTDPAITITERAIALLWYYRETQEFEERSASELARDLHDCGFARPNVTRLDRELRASRDTHRGQRPGTFQISAHALARLDGAYRRVLQAPVVRTTGALLPNDTAAGTRVYLERLVHQINASYESGLYDAAAVLCRRLMESLVIEVYVHNGRHNEIQLNGVFVALDRLIGIITNDATIPLARNSAATMSAIKLLGDTAAHDRTYITPQVDIDDIKARYRRLIVELLHVAGIT